MRNTCLLISLVFLAASCTDKKTEAPVTKIAFGSCGHQDDPQPVLAIAAEQSPDAFVFLGDNIYGDTDIMDTLRAKYGRLGAKPEYRQLEKATKIYATWDDHDFGRNDAGKWYPYKEASKQIFLEFFKEPAESERRKHEGIYTAEYIKTGDKTIQLILLDVRTFRNELRLYQKGDTLPYGGFFYTPDYYPYRTADSSLLGAKQWEWLEKELQKPADLRLIGSGSQFSIEYNGYEAWANFPHEQQRMLELIKKTKASGVLFITGDVHYAEISRLQEEGLYPVYDITSSGITSTWSFATQNKNRVEGPVMDNHIGLLTITWEKDPVIRMEIIDKYRNSRIEYTIKRSEISF
ncbi:MAG: alkaline phosphatase family protein [Chitinophagaceae bacterium]|nr:alkaline phosphatase family protein [Chitinophagaceae bacterium]